MVVQVKPGGNVEDATAKNIFDRIGKIVHDQAKKNAEQYRSQLHGSLKNAIFEDAPKGQQTPAGPCQLKYKWHTNATNGKSYPCRTGTEERFSQVHGGECDEKKIKDSDSNGGACAPYRRLNLCVRNLENISALDKINNDTLLADVCLAALHEGAAIRGDHGKYQETNNDVNANICTMLARSFADIGDIIRGKDLYRGNNGKDKLEDKLKEVFGKIHGGLIKNGRNGKEAQEYYKKDDKDPNYYKLREDWWYANRIMVWYAITCGAENDSQYFRQTCGSREKGSATKGKCRCVTHDVPTYFDYVPQYLRWFEEWGEEFCRLRKHKLQNAIKNCRGDSEGGKKLYCDLNGFDCTQTAKGKNQLVEGADCKKCTVPCDNFVHWIDNQKEEFLKQKEKYADEIKKEEKTIQGTNGKINNIYEKDFYRNLKEHYNDVKDFLEKLSKGKICEGHPEVKKKTSINFKDDQPEDIFSHTEYCQACPWCGAEKGEDGKWKAKNDTECAHKNENKFNNGITTPISILSTDRGKTKILEKLKTFCEDDQNIKNDIWKCHYEKNNENDQSDDSNICVLQNVNIGKKEEKSMPYHPFFWKWVTEMLIDSMYWRKELKRCTNNQLTKCKNKKCNNDCKCYEKWVKQKEEEWKQMEKHFKTQDFGKQEAFLGQIGYDFALKTLLNVEDILTNIKDTYGDVKEIKDIKQMLENENNQEEGAVAVTENKNTIDKLLDHEKKIAEKCKNCQETQKQPTGEESLARAEVARDNITHHDDADEVHDKDIDQRDLNIKVEDEDHGPDDQGTAVERSEPPATEETTTPPDVCAIVSTALTETNLKDACTQKYGYPQRHWGWKCIPSGNTSEPTSGATTGGSICIPPRRRRLYVGKLHDWATNTVESTKSLSPPASTSATSSESPKGDPLLLTAFVESAAVETFFLWHKYKEEKKQPAIQNGGLPLALPPEGSQEKDPQQLLQEKGEIPEEFKRQMFYTLGDYRDILFSGSKDAKNGFNYIFSGDKEMSDREKNIKEEITKFFEQNDDKKAASGTPSPTVETPSQPGDKRTALWSTFAQPIWNAMVCALTYDTDSGEKGGTPTQNEGLKGALLDDSGNKPKKEEYQYDQVKLEENSATDGPKPQKPTASGDNTPTLLSQFVLRPTYFRYLEEWGETFCTERKKRLEEVRKACRETSSGNDTFCSGDGHDCKVPDLKHNNMFEDPNCPRCYEQCRKYRKWIDIKFVEYHKQEKKYEDEYGKLTKGNCSGGDGDDNKKFCEKLKKNRCTAADFFKELKHCKDGQTGGEKNKTDFENPETTFGPLEYCKTCPFNGVTCNGRGGTRGRSATNGCTAVNGNNWESVFKKTNGNSENSTANITVEMIDRRAPFIKEYLKNSEKLQKSKDSFKTSRLFKGIRNQDWTCKFNGENMDICKLTNFNNEIDLNEYTTFKVLLIYWLEDFIEGYYILKKRKVFEQCTENGGETCSEESKNDCACVKVWVEKKKNEWEKIKDNFKDRKSDDGDTVVSKVRNFLEILIPQISAANDKRDQRSLDELEKSLGCNCAGSSENGKPEKKDVVECLLKKLGEKAKTCQSKHSGETQNNCVQPSPLEEPDEPLEETEENQVAQPKFCPPVEEKKKEVEDACKAVDPNTVPDDNRDKKNEEDKVEESAKESTAAEEPSAPAGPQGPSSTTEEKPSDDPNTEPVTPQDQSPDTKTPKEKGPKPPKVEENPFDPTILQTTIPFGIAIALTSIVFLFLKKKTKSSVGNLFQILQIPKSDYDIPTKLSPNRYIPYTSGKYRGKRYIYLEGDSGTDSGYTDHYSDITSSSESEYEELDINDIYVPGSPKYKTLIEVVLEPSGNNTTASGNNTTASGNNTTASGNNTTASGNNTPSDNTPTNKFADNEWNTLKDEFISQYLPNTEPNTEPNILHDNLDNNTHPTMSRDNMEEKPFIMSIHDRDLYSGEEYNYDMSTNSGNNDLYSGENNVYGGIDPTSDNHVLYSGNHHPYSGIDLINDSLSGNKHIDIYDEILKRKENELFGTEHHPKHTNTHNVAKPARDDPLHNQLELFHKWLDRHRDMCEKWENHHERLAKLKEEWENDTSTSGNTHPSDSNKTLNTDVSIQIHMDNPKPINEFSNMDTYPNNSSMDTILDDLDKPFNEPYYDVQDDIYYDVHDHDTSTVDTNAMDVPSKVQIEMDVNTKLVKEKYPIGDVWDI